MTAIERQCLQLLRMFGPCSNYEIARRSELDRHWTYQALAFLVRCGCAEHPKRQEWAITAKGIQWLEQQPAKPLGIFEGES